MDREKPRQNCRHVHDHGHCTNHRAEQILQRSCRSRNAHDHLLPAPAKFYRLCCVIVFLSLILPSWTYTVQNYHSRHRHGNSKRRVVGHRPNNIHNETVDPYTTIIMGEPGDESWGPAIPIVSDLSKPIVILLQPWHKYAISPFFRDQCIQIVTGSPTKESCSLPPYCGEVEYTLIKSGWFSSSGLCTARPFARVGDYANDATNNWVTQYWHFYPTGFEPTLISNMYFVRSENKRWAIATEAYLSTYPYVDGLDNLITPPLITTTDGRYCTRTFSNNPIRSSLVWYDSPNEALYYEQVMMAAAGPYYDCEKPIRPQIHNLTHSIYFVPQYNSAGCFYVAYFKPLASNQLDCPAYYQTANTLPYIVSSFVHGIGHAVVVTINSILHYIYRLLSKIPEFYHYLDNSLHLSEITALTVIFMLLKYQWQSSLILSFSIVLSLIGLRRDAQLPLRV